MVIIVRECVDKMAIASMFTNTHAAALLDHTPQDLLGTDRQTHGFASELQRLNRAIQNLTWEQAPPLYFQGSL